MAKVAVIDDHREYVEMEAALLRKAGHEVYTCVAPIDWEQLINFGPQVLVFGVYRRPHAYSQEITVPQDDILGYAALGETERYPAIQTIPIVILGESLVAKDVPTSVHYDLFLSMPNDVALLLPKVEELATKVKTRRKLSGYICPKPGCGSRLVYFKEPVRDLFCPKCGTAVTLLDDGWCSWLTPDGAFERSEIDQIVARPEA